MTALEQLLGMAGKDDPFTVPSEEIAALQLEAARERFADMVTRVRVLERRASEAGVARVERLSDMVPLLFAHSNYKSYPDSFVSRGQWGHLLRWLQTLSAVDVSGADVTSVADVDEFVDKVNTTGALVLCTSGTSGKVSFLVQSSRDREVLKEVSNTYFGWPYVSPIAQDQSAIVIQMAPARGHSHFVETYQRKIGTFAAPENAHCMQTDFRIADINRMGTMRKALANGTATPEQIALFERESAERAAQTNAALNALIDIILDNRGKRLLIGGTYIHLYRVVDEARRRGIAGGDWDGTVLSVGGGLKGSTLPEDYEAQVKGFFAGAAIVQTYGMSEMSTLWPKCEDGHYHRPPWIVPLILDAAGTELLEPAGGRIEGRFAFLDLLIDGRWGGLISGDRVVCHTGTCSCGRPGPFLVDPISRYRDTGDDKLSCAGTIDSYIRGFITE
jgi:hypothetical protein